MKTITDTQAALVATLTAINDTATDSNTSAIEALRTALRAELALAPTLLMFAMKGMDYWAKEGLNEIGKQATEADKITYRRSLTVANIHGFWTRKQYSDSLKPVVAKTATGKRGATVATDYTALISELHTHSLIDRRENKKHERIEGFSPEQAIPLAKIIALLQTGKDVETMLSSISNTASPLCTKYPFITVWYNESLASLNEKLAKASEIAAKAEADRLANLIDSI